MMTKGEFIDLVKDPGRAMEFAVDEFQSLVEQFPYCQPLRYLQLRCLADKQSIQYPSTLKVTSAYAPDRGRLFRLIHATSEQGGLTGLGIENHPDETAIANSEGEVAASDDFPALTVMQPEVEEPAPDATTGIGDATEAEPIKPFEPAPDTVQANKLTADLQQVTFTEDNDDETAAQEALILRLKELDLWPEDEPMSEAEGKTDPATAPISHLHENEPTVTAQVGIIEKDAASAKYDGSTETLSGHDPNPEPALLTDYFSIPGTADSGGVDLKDQNDAGRLQEARIAIEGNKQTFIDWLKLFGGKSPSPPPAGRSEKRSETGGSVDGKRTNEMVAEREEKNTGPTGENELTKAKVVYSKADAGRKPSRPSPADSDEITASVSHGSRGPAVSENPVVKKPLPDPMLVTTDPPKTKLPPEQLIERFISEEPRITPSKSTFYSPVNMARKSVMETEDLVTETLAGIFARQGNFLKAIQYYEILSLKFPEKSRYFAGLIQELNKKLNS